MTKHEIIAQIYGNIATLQGMQAENNLRAFRDEPPAYGFDDFHDISTNLYNLGEMLGESDPIE